MDTTPEVTVIFATEEHLPFAEKISKLIDDASKVPGTGIAQRTPEYIALKIKEGKGIIAFDVNQNIAGFCYIETWEDGKYIANSGLIVAPEFRKIGLGKKIKEKAFELSQLKYPNAKLFGLTTNPAVMKINSELGYRPVAFSDLTTDDKFWKGCESCEYYDILTRLQRKICLCTAMVYDPQEKREKIIDN